MGVRVSVIVPLTKGELRRSLESLQKQELNDLQVLLVGNGRESALEEAAAAFAAAEPDRFTVLSTAGESAAALRNAGVAAAEGTYIAFMDPGDYAEPFCYREMAETAEREAADVVVCGVTAFSKHKFVKHFLDPKLFGKTVEASPRILEKTGAFSAGKLIKKTVFTEEGLAFPEDQEFSEEALAYRLLLSAGRKVFALTYPAYYRVSGRGKKITSVDPWLGDAMKSCEAAIERAGKTGESGALHEELEYLTVSLLYGGRFRPLWRTKHRKTARAYVSRTIDFLNEHFPEWRKNRAVHPKNASKKKRIAMFIKTHKVPAFLYLAIPKGLIRAAKKFLAFAKKTAKKLLIKLGKDPAAARKKRTDAAKQKAIRAAGMQVMAETQKTLRALGAESFADFGTCLGLVREGQLLKHDIDMDLGVIAAPEQRDGIRVALEKKGYRLWRQYLYNGSVVEESYHYKDIKVDFNYYVMTADYARTWLFYREPGYVYKDKYTRHVVEMNYDPITGTHEQEFNGVSVVLPDDPEHLMEEKYGPGWRVPDTGWIYWKSPAATLLPETSYFILYENN